MATHSMLTKLKHLTFGRGKRQCHTVEKTRYLPDGRIAALGRCEDEFSADTIYLWKTTSIMPNKIIKDRIAPATDMALTSSGEVMVLRKEDPLVRVFDPNADTPAHARDIQIEVDENIKEELLFLETTDTGYIFIVHGDPQAHIKVFDPKGMPIQSVKIGKAGGMAYSKTTKTLYSAADDRVNKYHWDGKALTEVPSNPHGVNGFSCTDVSIGSNGEVYVVGYLKEAARVFHVIENSKGAAEMKALAFHDKEARNSYSPWSCVQGDQFVLVYGDNKPEVGLFQLS